MNQLDPRNHFLQALRKHEGEAGIDYCPIALEKARKGVVPSEHVTRCWICILTLRVSTAEYFRMEPYTEEIARGMLQVRADTFTLSTAPVSFESGRFFAALAQSTELLGEFSRLLVQRYGKI